MKVLLTEDVENLGLAGEVAEVADGYGRNYLLPQGLAVLATPGALKDAKVHRRRAAERRARMEAEMAALLEAVSETTLTFYAKAGEKGQLFGSVTTSDIADKLSERVDEEIDRRKIILDAPIKQVGTHTVTLRFDPENRTTFDVLVESMDELEEEEEAAEEAPPVEEVPAEEEAAADEEMVVAEEAAAVEE